MKIKVDIEKLYQLMAKRKIKSLTELSSQSGVSYNSLGRELLRTGTLSRENLWLISDYFECSINDFVYPDWEDGA